MKKVSKNFEKILAKAALVSASNNVNSTCRWYVYQELVPQSAKKLKKIK
ncbi:MAG: cyclic lactone autoinducer peptide [Clostridia bacterium]